MSESRPDHRLSVAPMIDWTDRHCRFFHRQLSRRTLLYTEMIVAMAALRGDRARLLDFDPCEAPIALQLGGADPETLAQAARIGADWGYDEINLNVGCPSDRVQSGAFGACLMRDPALVARCAAAMIKAVGLGGPDITVKCRLGVDDQTVAQTLPEFIDHVAQAGVRRFVIHARKAWLKGLSPAQNRTIPPLDYDLALRIKRERPELEIILNGGVESLAQARAHLAQGFDGVMIGRAAYHAPYDILARADGEIFHEVHAPPDPHEVIEAMQDYAARKIAQGGRLAPIARPMLGLFSGKPGAKVWRRILSENAHLPEAGPELFAQAYAQMRARVAA